MKGNGVTYQVDRIVGHGSFGVVFQATATNTSEVVAIKKVLQDKRFKVACSSLLHKSYLFLTQRCDVPM